MYVHEQGYIIRFKILKQFQLLICSLVTGYVFVNDGSL